MKISEKINKVNEYIDSGLSYLEVSKIMSISIHTIKLYRNAKKREKLLQNELAKQKEKEEQEQYICELLKKCKNYNQVCKILGKRSTNTNYEFLQKIVNKYSIDISHFTSFSMPNNIRKTINNEDILKENGSPIATSKLKKRLFTYGLKERKCERCGRTEWEGEPIPLELHHINGNNKDNRIENLQILCPNCHALTDSYCGKNKFKKIKKKTKTQKEPKYTIEEIINIFKEKGSISQVGKTLGISDNAVRKRCKRLGLPYHTKELKEYVKNI